MSEPGFTDNLVKYKPTADTKRKAREIPPIVRLKKGCVAILLSLKFAGAFPVNTLSG
jgi:hypothetical protein